MTRWPPDVERALLAARLALARYRPGEESTSVYEIPKLDLADAVLAWAERIERLPGRADRPVRAMGRYRRRRSA